MHKNSRGFTILEILIVVVIVGILSVLGLVSFSGPKEQAVEREAQANLKLIAAAEKIYRMENGGYVNCTDTLSVNSLLALMIPASDSNWKYRVTGSSGSVFLAKAQRTSGQFAGSKIFCINETMENSTNVGCGSSW